jgi:hypothetical protein
MGQFYCTVNNRDKPTSDVSDMDENTFFQDKTPQDSKILDNSAVFSNHTTVLPCWLTVLYQHSAS